MEIFTIQTLTEFNAEHVHVHHLQPEFELDEHFWLIERPKCQLEFAIRSKIVTNVIDFREKN